MKSPLEYITLWDLIILMGGFLLRFFMAVKHTAFRVDSFEWGKYFDNKHVIRWVTHLIASLLFLVAFPQLFMWLLDHKFIELTIDKWFFIGSALIGFLGYDLVKICETVSLLVFKKWKNVWGK